MARGKITNPIVCLLFALLLVTGVPGAGAEYEVKISSESPRIAIVKASVHPLGGMLSMNDENNQGLPKGWATFVRRIDATDKSGNRCLVTFLTASKWKIERCSGAVDIRYELSLAHDQTKLNFGDNGAAYVTPDGVMWAGRTLFIAGRKEKEIRVRFSVPERWTVSTPWQTGNDGKSFLVRGTDDLVNSAIFAGLHTETVLSAGKVKLRLAISGENSRSMLDSIKKDTSKYLNYFAKTYDSDQSATMLMIAADRSYWGGEVMGRAISLSIGGKAFQGMNPLSVLSHVIAHEIFHIFSLQRVNIAAGEETKITWFMEGFSAEHAAWTTRLRLREISPDAFVNDLGQQYSKYLKAAKRNISLEAAGIEKDKNYDLVYSGAYLASIALDLMVRNETDGRKSLEDLWRRILREYPANGPELTNERLHNAVRAEFGDRIAKTFREFATSTKPISFPKFFSIAGIESKEGKLIAPSQQNKLWARYMVR